MNHKKILYTTLTLFIFIFTACAKQTPTAPVDTNRITYRPLAPEECQVIRDNAAAALNAQFSLAENSLADYGLEGTACYMEANGTGTDFDLVNSLNAILGILTGWEPNLKLSAGGPTGIMQGYTKGSAVLLVNIHWTPSPDANCPEDQPISACALAPEQKLFTIALLAAQK